MNKSNPNNLKLHSISTDIAVIKLKLPNKPYITLNNILCLSFIKPNTNHNNNIDANIFNIPANIHIQQNFSISFAHIPYAKTKAINPIDICNNNIFDIACHQENIV